MLVYSNSDDLEISWYDESDLVGSLDDMKSTPGYLF